MAYDREQLMTALRNADAAGDTESATRIAQMIRSQTQQPQQERSLAQDALLGLSEAGGAMAQAVVNTAISFRWWRTPSLARAHGPEVRTPTCPRHGCHYLKG